uniref:Carbonic anhydrase n=1 Tax=Triatoma infestans TaxID=30076 RepID=A0A161MK01_TRIIF
MIYIRIPPLEWYNFTSTPESLKLTNTSYSVVLTGTWLHGEMPYITGGPLLEDYVFSQIHFHWGGIVQEDVPGKPNKNMWILSGSEHSVDDDQYPFEMHAVFRKRCCETHEAAKRVVDGIVIIVYLCADVTEEPNPNLEPVTKSIKEFFAPFTSVAVDTLPLGSILPMFTDDYLLYLGYMKYKCNHGIMWLITRQSFPISLYQLFKFQCVQNKHSHPITNPFRQVQSLDDRTMFLVNPSPNLESLIHFRDKDLLAAQDYWDEYSFDFKNTNFLEDKDGNNEGDEAGGAAVEKESADKKKKGKKGKKK